MPGAAAFPTLFTTNSSTNSVSGGKHDDVKTTITSRVSKPKFVDNVVYHAIYKKEKDSTGRQYSVTKPLVSDFQVTHGKKYRFVEEEESLLLTHVPAHGVKSDVPAFFNSVRMETGKTPPNLLFAGKETIRPYDITTATKGSRINLRNLKGKTLKQLGFPDTSTVQAGQIVNVGLRTTDIVMQLFNDKKYALNSISLGHPYSGSTMTQTTTYKGNSTITHSTKFLSANYISTTIPDAIRAIARNDYYSMVTDCFGNFIYTPGGFRSRDESIAAMVAGQVSRSGIADTANRVVVRGQSIALNDKNEVVLEDTERQKSEGMVKSQTYDESTATSLAATKRAARQLLRLNRKATGSVDIKDIPFKSHIAPGDVVTYQDPHGKSTRQAIIETTHFLTEARSDFSMMAYDTGIERVLGAGESQRAGNAESKASSGNVIDEKKQFSLGSVGFNVRGLVERRYISKKKARAYTGVTGMIDTGNEMHSGFLLGHRGYDTGNASARGAIGTGLTVRTTGSHSGGTLTVSSTTGFPTSGNLTMRKSATEAVQVAYTGKTSTTFTGVTLRAPTGGSIPTGTCDVHLLRPKSHEIGTVKGITTRRRT